MTDTFTLNTTPLESKNSQSLLLGESYNSSTGKVNDLFDSNFNYNFATASLIRSQSSVTSSPSAQEAPSPSYSHSHLMNHQNHLPQQSQHPQFQFQPHHSLEQLQPYHYAQQAQFQLLQSNGPNNYIEPHNFVLQRIPSPQYSNLASFFNKGGSKSNEISRKFRFREDPNTRSSVSDSGLSSSQATLLQLRYQHTRDSSIGTKSLESEYPKAVKPKVATTYWEEKRTTCYQVELRGVMVSRREDNNQINGTKLLNTTGMSRGKRDGILKNEKQRNGEVVKSGSMNLKGIWIPFERAQELARNEGVDRLLFPLFVKDLKSFYAKKGEQLRCDASDGEAEDDRENMVHSLPLSSPSDHTNGSAGDSSDPSTYADTYGLLQDNYFSDANQIKDEDNPLLFCSQPKRTS